MPLEVALETVDDPIRAELARCRPLVRHLNLPLGKMITGWQTPPNREVQLHLTGVFGAEKDRWKRNQVREEDIVAWWNLGAVMHCCYEAFDNFFIGAQVIDAMTHAESMSSKDELFDYAAWSVKKRFALFGATDSDDGTENGRLPHELRARVESWTLLARREFPDELLDAIDRFESYNALCREMIRQGVI